MKYSLVLLDTLNFNMETLNTQESIIFQQLYEIEYNFRVLQSTKTVENDINCNI